MNVTEKHVVTGMVTDMGISRFEPTKVSYARNIRISTVNDKSELLTVTNEKGPIQITPSTNGIPGGTVVGSALLNDILVLFIHTSAGNDSIYKVSFTDEQHFIAIGLYTGNLGFDVSYPIETLPVYENEQVQKIYWIDGIHQLRCINIADETVRTSANTTQFDASPEISLNHTLNITKKNDGGEFPAGSIQYAFTYHNQYGPETNVFEVSPLYELSPKTKGVAADGRTTCSFLINITGTDSNFSFVRAYAIIRTSENATPSVRIVGDFSNKSQSISFTDNGELGSSVDASVLLFVGGEPVAPSTFATKDNTLFLGNITITRPSIGSLIYSGTQTLAQKIAELREAGTIPIRSATRTDYNAGSSLDRYDYRIDNNRPSTVLRRFKYGETYRLGIIAQYKTGIWSEVLWIGDYTNTIKPTFLNQQTAGVWEIVNGISDNIIATIATKLLDAGYKRIAPVVVYPEGKDRTVFCQGIVSATVYNVEDRYNNRPFSQASWFFRPISEGFGIAASPHAMLTPARETRAINPGYNSPEIQINNGPRLFLPRIKGKWESESAGASDTQLSNIDMVGLCRNDYYVDTSIVTLNSPDIEFDDSLQQEDFTGLKFRIVGIAKTKTGNAYKEMYSEITAGLHVEEKAYSPVLSRFQYVSPSKFINPSFSFFGYLTHIKTYGTLEGINKSGYHFYEFYPWHKTGRICGSLWTKNFAVNPDDRAAQEEHYDKENQIDNICTINKKVISNMWYAVTDLSYPSFVNTNIDTSVIKLFDDTQSDFIPLGDTADSSVYYGNIDSVRVPVRDSLSSSVASHDGESFITKEVIAEGTSLISYTRAAKKDAYYPCLSSIEFNDKELPAPSDGYWGNTMTPEEVLSRYTNYVMEDIGYDNTPVPIKYKSTKHAVIALDHTANEIPSLYRNNDLFTSLAEGSTPSIKPFWSDSNQTFSTGKVAFYPYVPRSIYNPSSNTAYPLVYIGELYRDFTTEEANMRFGGNDEKALLNNIWKRCGDAVRLDGFIAQNPTTVLAFTEGDTYLTRYDCLKTYPYSDNDVNSIVEILSTDIETRVNLDARYDNARGLLDNTMVTPENINLVNRLGYEQTNQFFTFATQDYSRESIDEFPASVTISQEKTPGSDVDAWMQVNMTAIQDLDGTHGKLTALETFNNDVYAFQENGFSQILFNSRVQIPTSDGQPIEITNGMKLQGTRYISDTIGCQNKWSITKSPRRLYWFDGVSGDLWGFGQQGLDNLSTRLGMKGWVKNFKKSWTLAGNGMNSFYDKKNGDIYFCNNSSDDYNGSLLYSEALDSFISILDYNHIQSLHNVQDNSIIIKNNYASSAYSWDMWNMWKGQYNVFFGTYKPFVLRFIANYQPANHKVFDTVQWRSDSWNSSGQHIPSETFNKLQVWNQYQKSALTTLTNSPYLKKKFNTFRALVPRDTLGNTLTNADYRPTSTFQSNKFGRIRGNYATVELTHDAEDTYKMQFYDLDITEFI